MKKRLIGLDLFRIFLAIVVFMFHSNIFVGCDYGFLNFLAGAGSSFMTGFFMLSGFSIFYATKDKELYAVGEIKDFYVKRMISIIPLFWVVMIFYHVIWGGVSVRELFFLFPMDMLGLRSTMFFLPNNQFIWFISNIIFCYLCYPFLQGIVKQIETKTKLFWCVVLIALVVYVTQVLPSVFVFNAYPYYSIFYRLAEFLIGMLLASIKVTNKKLFTKPRYAWLLAVMELIILLLGIRLINHTVLHESFLLFCFAMMLLTFSECECRWLENSKVIGYVSACTYALFLAQVWTLRLFEKTIPDFIPSIDQGSRLLRLLIVWGSTFVLTILLHELIEKPCKKLLSKLFLKS